jgi:competence protein ComEC
MSLFFCLLSFCIGIATYFALPFEPAVAYPIFISILCAINFLVWRKKRVIALQILSAFALGFFYSYAYTRLVDIPRIDRTMRDTEIVGIVQNIDYMPDKTRIFLRNSSNDAIYRLSFREDVQTPSIGDEVRATATLFVPNTADIPGGFDPAEMYYFKGISATGFATNLEVIKPDTANNISTFRNYLHNKLDSKLFDSLVLGYKHTLTDEENNAWKAAGVSHVFSISGFHITLVSGWLFAVFYFLFRLIPPLTKRIPARFPAMGFAFLGLLFYLFLSGADVATQRAFLMTTLMFTAFIAGRNVFTMRNAALVFAGLLFLNPHYLLEPGFQLSFSAIFGLIWWFSDAEYEKLSWLRKIWRALKVMIATTIVATFFTAPFVAYHFNTAQIYSLPGNLLCLPIFSLLIMPLTMLGLTDWATGIYDWTLGIAKWIQNFPWAELPVPNIPGYAFILLVAALLIVIASRFKNKATKYFIAAGLALLSIILIAIKPKPVFYSTADNEVVAVVQDGALHFNRNKSSNNYFAFATWKRNNMEKDDTPNKRIKCYRALCIIQTKNWSLAYTEKFMPLIRDIKGMCENDFLVSYLDVKPSASCKAKVLKGGFVIYENGKVEYTISDRFWH